MLVGRKDLKGLGAKLQKKTYLSLDTETTGLQWYNYDQIVSVIISDDEDTYYFNFTEYPPEDNAEVLDWEDFKEVMASVFSASHILWFMHNAKFDLSMLARESITVEGLVHDTMVVERLLDSNAQSLALKNVAPLYGLQKSSEVEDFLVKNKHYELREVPGKQRRDRFYYWHMVPFDLLWHYGEQDARITYQIGRNQLLRVNTISDKQGDISNNFRNVYNNELLLVKTVFHMEQYGVLVDIDYCREAISYYEARLEELKAEFRERSGEEFLDSSKALWKALPSLRPGKINSRSGNPSYESEVLEEIGTPEAKLILDIRSQKKYLDFFNGFIYYASTKGVLHASLNQAGTKTGRFSCSNPNLQQLTKDSSDECKYPVRRALVPRDGAFFVMIDYDQQEYRMMLDYCGALNLIKAINKGLDVHSATAEIASTEEMPISRKMAKTANFATLYGSGIANLSRKLGVPQKQAKAIRDAIFRAAPSMKLFLFKVQERAKIVGSVRNWLGRIVRFDPPLIGEKEYYYRAPNALIQGGCADVVKVAMNECAVLLSKYESKMVLSIHDEIVFEIAYGEEFLVDRLKWIMENVYKAKNLSLTATVEYSEHSLADRKPWPERKGEK